MNDNPIVIRSAVSTDVDALVSLLAQLFGIERAFAFDAEVHRRGIESLLASPGAAWVWVAISGGDVAGMCTAQRLISTAMGAPVLHIEDVVVDHDHRGAGVGSALMTHVERWAVDNGYRRLQLVADNDNPPALAFYRSRNWEKTSMIWHRKHLPCDAGNAHLESGGA